MPFRSSHAILPRQSRRRAASNFEPDNVKLACACRGENTVLCCSKECAIATTSPVALWTWQTLRIVLRDADEFQAASSPPGRGLFSDLLLLIADYSGAGRD